MDKARFTLSYAFVFAVSLCICRTAGAASVKVEIHSVDDSGVRDSIGSIEFEDSTAGLRIQPALKNLPPGMHGMHLHESPSCAPGMKDGRRKAAMAAGEHYDPMNTGVHLGPESSGHLGDLPALEVANDGTARKPLTATRLRTAQLRGRALVIHAGGDNYADAPKPLGGGGDRIACGVL